jgi:glycogen operon protein
VNERNLADVTWHGCKLYAPPWNDPGARVLAYTLGGFAGEADVHVMLNMYWDALPFELPPVAGRTWHRVADTSLPSPSDILGHGKEIKITGDQYVVNGRSVVVLVSK